MRIERLELVNFRCFERWEHTFGPQVNVLIGRNGTGKTAVLDALAIAVEPFLHAMRALERGRFSSNDVRLLPIYKGGDLTLEWQNPVRIDCRGALDARAWNTSRVFEVGVTKFGAIEERGAGDVAELHEHGGQLALAVSNGEDVTLPLVAYFGTDRLWLPLKASEPVELMGPGSRLRGYLDCLRPASNFRRLEGWFQRMELIKLQDGAAPPMLDAAKDAIVACLEGWDDVRYDVRRYALVARTADGSRALPFHMLSDGVRNMIGMVGEIAYRAALLNPHLGADAAKKTPGVVLIDEVDQHLHPSWQRRILDDLRRTFPEVQFFCTTHSPLIVQSVSPEEMILLDDGQPAETEHRSVEEVLEWEMGVPGVERSKRWRDMMKAAEEYYRVLRQANGASTEETARLKAELDRLTEPFADNPAYAAFLKMEREAAGLGNGAP